MSSNLTPEIAKELLSYDKEFGVFTWRLRARKWFQSDGDCTVWNTRYAGKEAGTITKMGNAHRRIIGVFGRKYRASRLAYFMVVGEWPRFVIDHLDGCATNDRWCNLREATVSQNNQNKKIYRNNTTGFKGVTACKNNKENPFAAQIRVCGEKHFLGYFESAEQASAAYENAARHYFGRFRRMAGQT